MSYLLDWHNTSAVALWRHCYLFTCGKLCYSSFQTPLSCKYRCESVNKLHYQTTDLLRPNAVCRYVYCIVYVAILSANAVTMHFHWGEQPPKLPLPLGDAGPHLHLIHGSLGPPEYKTQTASRSVQWFLQGSQLCPTDTQTDHTTSIAIRHILRFA